ncbi:aldo/keto reductase [Streptomyces syringium]|uniref:aldo/keto reductase n=1 Tax=Streptomyces syringium TaxID=76729 RepID=UPI0033DB1645
MGQQIFAHPLGVHCGAIGEGATGGPAAQDRRFLDGLRRAVECGATLLDTADSYGAGHSERVVGRLLRECRDVPLQLSSKVGRLRGSAPHPYAGRRIHHQLEQTLENLYTEHLDLYILASHDFGEGDRYLGTAIEQMRTLQQLGSIRAIGMRGPHTGCWASPAEQRTRAERFRYLFRLIKPDVVWAHFNALTPMVQLEGEDLFSFTARHGVGLILAAPLAQGVLTGKHTGRPVGVPPGGRHAWTSAAGFTSHAMESIAAGLEILQHRFGDAPGSLTRLALRSCLQQADHCVVVCGFTSAQQVVENYRCLGAPLTPSELAAVAGVYAQIRADLHRVPDPQEVHARL